jgi:type I restriction enzyme S subunit
MSDQLSIFQIGSTFSRINVADIKALVVLVPPRDEQDEIVRYLDDAAERFAEPTARAQREIELIREYRTRTLVEVVTGKEDVRTAAARLPGDSGALAPLSDLELADFEDLDDSSLEDVDEVSV